ncbi:mucin-7-like isoform X2 [Bacillus rossius redtenbacheri]|uniref:mucin-7-like isoform X2 n=1 Tax=Bacillus rossius redtenbacheri TaxID=93214 RepID=UPI002FDE002E
MFKGTYQQGLVTVLFSGGPRPLAIWGSCARSGQVRRVMDDDTRSLVLELSGTNVATTYIHAPPCARGSLALRLPFFVMHVKNLNRYFTLEIQVLDDKNMRRRIAFSNFTSCSQVNINLSDFVRRIYGTAYIETQRIQVHANCRIRRIYFADRIYSAEELPADYKLYDPNQTRPSLRRKKSTPAEEPKTEFIDIVAVPYDTQQIQITLPDYTSMGVSVPPPSEVETPRSGITEPALDETDAQTSAPGEPTEEPSAPDGLVAPPESTEEPTAPPESTEEPTAPPESTEEPAAPPESTEEPAAPPESTEEPTSPPESTEEPAAPPESTEQPVAQSETAEEPVAPSEPTEEPITEATSPDEHNEETPAPD